MTMRFDSADRLDTLASDLHDGAMQHVIAALQRVRVARHDLVHGDIAAARRSLDETDAQLREALVAMRRILAGTPLPTRTLGCVAEAIDAAVADVRDRFGLHVDVTYGEGARDSLSSTDTAPLVHRLVLELLGNVSRHAGVDHAEIEVHVGTCVEVVVRDAGSGFDLTQRHDDGFGLRNVRRIVEQRGGTLHVDSTRGFGTSVRLLLPS